VTPLAVLVAALAVSLVIAGQVMAGRRARGHSLFPVLLRARVEPDRTAVALAALAALARSRETDRRF
jgi:hypothetical protein